MNKNKDAEWRKELYSLMFDDSTEMGKRIDVFFMVLIFLSVF